MRTLLPKTFRIRALLLLAVVGAIVALVLVIPSRSATAVEDLIAHADLSGPHRYLPDSVLAEVNSKIKTGSPKIPPYTHSFETHVKAPTWIDRLMLRQPMEIQYTSNPIEPAYTGPITRHVATYHVGLFRLRETARTKTVLFEYYD